jgi:hypothetical protein
MGANAYSWCPRTTGETVCIYGVPAHVHSCESVNAQDPDSVWQTCMACGWICWLGAGPGC